MCWTGEVDLFSSVEMWTKMRIRTGLWTFVNAFDREIRITVDVVSGVQRLVFKRINNSVSGEVSGHFEIDS